jgi:hypothetical protein
MLEPPWPSGALGASSPWARGEHEHDGGAGPQRSDLPAEKPVGHRGIRVAQQQHTARCSPEGVEPLVRHRGGRAGKGWTLRATPRRTVGVFARRERLGRVLHAGLDDLQELRVIRSARADQELASFVVLRGYAHLSVSVEAVARCGGAKTPGGVLDTPVEGERSQCLCYRPGSLSRASTASCRGLCR